MRTEIVGGDGQGRATKDKRASYEPTARRAAAHILEADPTRFTPSRMSKYAHWYEDPEGGSLVAVVTPGERPTACDEVLAYGLAWQQNRDLLLVLPGNMVTEALTRLPWIDTEVRVWQFDGNGEPHPLPSLGRFQVLEHLADLSPRSRAAYDIDPRYREWLSGIDLTGLSAHQRSCLSWHHDGLQVLRATQVRKGLRVQAGVQYRNAPAGREPFDKTFDAAPTAGELAAINERVRLARQDGRSRTSQMREHRLQATLATQPEALGLTRLWREFPGYRGLRSSSFAPSGRTGYIDFLGADEAGVLHVVETKIGHDPRVVLQALDYAIWVKANDAAIRRVLNEQGHNLPTPANSVETASTPAPMHLVLGSKGREPAFNTYLAGQIEALAGDCRVSVQVIDEPAADRLTLRRLPKRRMWTAGPGIAKPVAEPRWPEYLTGGLLGAGR